MMISSSLSVIVLSVLFALGVVSQAQTSPYVSYTFSVNPSVSGISYLSSYQGHTGVAVFDGNLHYLNLTVFPDDNGVLLPTTFGGPMTFEFTAQWLYTSS